MQQSNFIFEIFIAYKEKKNNLLSYKTLNLNNINQNFQHTSTQVVEHKNKKIKFSEKRKKKKAQIYYLKDF